MEHAYEASMEHAYEESMEHVCKFIKMFCRHAYVKQTYLSKSVKAVSEPKQTNFLETTLETAPSCISEGRGVLCFKCTIRRTKITDAMPIVALGRAHQYGVMIVAREGS